MASCRKTLYFFEPKVWIQDDFDFRPWTKVIIKQRRELLNGKYGPRIHSFDVHLKDSKIVVVANLYDKEGEESTLYLSKPFNAYFDLIPFYYRADGGAWKVIFVTKRGRVVEYDYGQSAEVVDPKRRNSTDYSERSRVSNELVSDSKGGTGGGGSKKTSRKREG